MTTLRVGGKARYLVEIETEEDLQEVADLISQKSMKWMVLGGGSNIIMADAGFDGIVVKMNNRGISIVGEKEDGVIVNVKSGHIWDDFVAWAVARNYAGISCLSGIPGCVGATPIQNVGAYGQEVSETITAVNAISLPDLEPLSFSNADCDFEYRDSRFKRSSHSLVITSVEFELKKNHFPDLAYRDLKERASTLQSLSELRDLVLRIRAEKGMVLSENDRDTFSAGSFFTNPMLNLDEWKSLLQRASEVGIKALEIPHYENDNRVKVPAAWLIEQSGIKKGFKLGNAGISTKHALALSNTGGAKAMEIRNLADFVRKSVEDMFGISLENEPQFVGEW